MSVPADRSSLHVEGRAPTRARYCSAYSSETAAERLADDLLLEILPRVPAKSLCRFRCVSKHWLGLIDHPDHRKKLPQTLAGFFYGTTSTDGGPDFFLGPPLLLTSVSGSPCPLNSISFTFLPHNWRVDVLDCCNGLLLCRWHGVSEVSHVVCNPATEKWVVIPDSGQAIDTVLIRRLGFDPAQSSHFHVFELLEDFDSWGPGPGITGVAVYSSETGGWVCKKQRWNQSIKLHYPEYHSAQTVVLNNHLYFEALGSEFSKCIAAVDTEGETWMNFGVPVGDGLIEAFFQCSQGCLHYANFYRDEDNGVVRLAVYVLENYESKEWLLKHVVDSSFLFGDIDVTLDWDFEWVGIHPECNSIYFTTGWDTTFMIYNMDNRQGKVIRDLKDAFPPYLTYVPFYAELQSLHMCHQSETAGAFIGS